MVDFTTESALFFSENYNFRLTTVKLRCADTPMLQLISNTSATVHAVARPSLAWRIQG